GLSPLRLLVAPRVLASMVALPLLAVFVAYSTIFSAYCTDLFTGNMPLSLYLLKTLTLVQLSDAVPALLRTVVFGCLVGVAGCYHGLTATGGTEGVGRAATRGVVVSVYLVFLADLVMVLVLIALK